MIRTLNESRYLDELLTMIGSQELDNHEVEVVVIDSGSTDSTLDIAHGHGCRITHIDKRDFSFGRSLNMGSKFAVGDILVYVSGHCVPCEKNWLYRLVEPLFEQPIVYAYGRQVGRSTTKFSERNIFRKYFPEYSKIPQNGFFCNNANSAILRSCWDEHRFDESLTGLEDMELAKRLVSVGGKIAYVAEAPVFHVHDESWTQVRRRFEREAIALQAIMPEIHVTFSDFIRYVVSGIILDSAQALLEKRLLREASGIFRFRCAQYYGSYRGNHEHRKLSQERKEQYFYPRSY